MKANHLRLLAVCETASGERVWCEGPLGRRRAWRRAAVAAAAGAIVAAGLSLGRPALHRPRPQFVRVTVGQGDTLWSLARTHGDPGQYVPDTVHRIRQANGLRSSQLVPGQELRIPVEGPARVEWRQGPILAVAADRAPGRR